MGKSSKPRSGSMQFWPRVRSKREHTRVRSWNKSSSNNQILAFAGYKAGMTHIQTTKTEKNKTYNINIPVTIIECPSLKPLSLKFYIQTPYGLKSISQINSQTLNKELSKRIKIPKTQKEEKIPEKYDELSLVVYTQPKLTKIGKKKPEIFEIRLNTDLETAKTLFQKEIKASEIFKPGQIIDARAITKGKGFQGTVKRFGISLKSHKSEKKRRSVGNLGSFTPRKTDWRVPQTGQMGYHKRTEYNKLIFSIDSDVSKINQKGGIKNYGLVKNEYILIKGSIPGPSKRLIVMTSSIRGTKEKQIPEINYISTESKQ